MTTLGANSGTEVLEKESTAASVANAGTYDLDGAIATADTETIHLIALDATVVSENIANADLTAATDGTQLLKALADSGAAKTAASLTVKVNGSKLFLAVEDGTNGYLYHLNPGSGNKDIVASEVSLMAIFYGGTSLPALAAAQITVG